jgi:hypothetical protein
MTGETETIGFSDEVEGCRGRIQQQSAATEVSMFTGRSVRRRLEWS